jgi:hypothetical protein
VQDHRRAVRPFADRHDCPIGEGRRSGDYANSAREWDNAPTRAVPAFAERTFELQPEGPDVVRVDGSDYKQGVIALRVWVRTGDHAPAGAV